MYSENNKCLLCSKHWASTGDTELNKETEFLNSWSFCPSGNMTINNQRNTEDNYKGNNTWHKGNK